MTSLLAALALLRPGVSLGLPSASALPARVHPGEAFLVLVRGAKDPPRAEIFGRALAFFAVRDGYAAVAALPVETPAGSRRERLLLAEGEGGPSSLELELEVLPEHFQREQIEVDQGFVAPHPPEVERRIAADRAALATAFAQPAAAPIFTGAFALPRKDRITGRFGVERILNGVKASQHYGLDLAGKVGDRVAAANAGKVVLVRDCWASGMTIVLFHGAGLYSTYLHLSRALVEEGVGVTRGQPIGLVGKSGRVSGPHLHWGVKVNDLYVDPESVLRLDFRVARPVAALR
ncbi:MAG TPA: M23 family metallopeptidase [Anaeromyxobacteraceae bacterium]|nr:M23 family metallopeptidase [Anaeromyxobacteraceae bacterium]